MGPTMTDDMVQTAPMQAGPARTGSVQARPARTDPTRTDLVQAGLVQARPARTDDLGTTAPASAPARHLDLLLRSGDSLEQACRATVGRERYLKAHLAALRAAAAYLAAHPSGRERRPDGRPGRGLWEALALSAPELREWASYFAATGARARRLLRAPDAGGTVASREADDLVRSAEAFRAVVAGLLDAPRRPGPARLTPLTR